jgi:hypothetical protein
MAASPLFVVLALLFAFVIAHGMKAAHATPPTNLLHPSVWLIVAWALLALSALTGSLFHRLEKKEKGRP